jgi:hypothetical protein
MARKEVRRQRRLLVALEKLQETLMFPRMMTTAAAHHGLASERVERTTARVEDRGQTLVGLTRRWMMTRQI